MAARSLSSDLGNKKQALLIGNNNYKKRRELQFCTNDAEDLANKLRSIGFKVTVGTNRTCEQMDRMIEGFNNQITQDDLVLFFFAGHGYQWSEQNFLIPIDDDRIKDDIDLKYKAINAQATLEKIMSCGPSAAILLLDCCRNSLERGSSNSNGLSSMRAVAGSFIAFACDANKTALDASPNCRNGIFTAHLLQHITQPNLTIDEIMYDVCDGVMKDTDDDQCPFRVSSLRRKIYLNQQLQSARASTSERRRSPDSALIPCEFCDKQIDLSFWSTHDQHCREQEACRIEARAVTMNREPVTEKLPCEHCEELFSVQGLRAHELICPKNRKNTARAAKLANPSPLTTVDLSNKYTKRERDLRLSSSPSRQCKLGRKKQKKRSNFNESN